MVSGSNFVTITGYAQRVFDNGKIVALTIGTYAGKHKDTGKTRRDYIPCIHFPSNSMIHKAILAQGGWKKMFDDKQVTITGCLKHGKAYNKTIDAEVWKTDVLIDSISINAVQVGAISNGGNTTPVQPAGQELPAMEDDLPF